MRGEDSIVYIQGAANLGSPPHARGRLLGGFVLFIDAGITPACAGKTGLRTFSRCLPRDHPRMRGEDNVKTSNSMTVRGSPPHARGRLRVNGHEAQCRLDHPRMRGEDNREVSKTRFAQGSPPHARGRRTTRFAERRNTRITPACAGKTKFYQIYLNISKDHPRMRGEDATLPSTFFPDEGSPPHARGRPRLTA